MPIVPASYTVVRYAVHCAKCEEGIVMGIVHGTEKVKCPACGKWISIDWANWDVPKCPATIPDEK